MSKNKPFKTVIIGTGGIARAHFNGIQEAAPKLELAAVMDIDPAKAEAFAKDHGIPRHYHDLEEILSKEQPDLVQVATPPAFHADLSIKAMEAGAWVLCEKPLCASLAELDAIAEAEKRTGRYCASVFQWRYGPGMQHLKSLADSGDLGRPLLGLCLTLWYRGKKYYEVPWRGTWKDELGGPTMGHGIHAMDSFLYLMGDWTEIRAVADTLDRDLEVEDLSMALVRFANGARGNVVNSVLSPRQESVLRLDYQKATVELKHLYRYNRKDWTYTPAPTEAENSLMESLEAFSAEEEDFSSHGKQLLALCDDMEAGRAPSTSGADARRTLTFLTGLYKSALTGQPVTPESIHPGDPFYSCLHGGRGADWRVT